MKPLAKMDNDEVCKELDHVADILDSHPDIALDARHRMRSLCHEAARRLRRQGSALVDAAHELSRLYDSTRRVSASERSSHDQHH